VYELEHWGMRLASRRDGRSINAPFGGMTTHFGKAPRSAPALRRPPGHAMLHTMYGQALRHAAEFYVEYFASI